MRNRFIKTLATMALTLTVCTVPMQAEAKVSTPRYTTVPAVVGCDTHGEKNLQVFYANGQIHEFNSDFEIRKSYKVGDIVKVHFKTNRTKTVKDDVVLDVYRSHSKNETLKIYSREYKQYYKTIRTMQEEEKNVH